MGEEKKRYRLEHDSIGEKEVPEEAYYGVQTLPCLEVSTIIFRSRPTPKTLLKAWK